MPYVQRDGLGNIIGVYANQQPGYATEFLAATDAAVVDFLTPQPASPGPVAVLQDALIAKGIIAQSDLTAAATSMKAAS